jgi:hypothetical protein
MDDGEDEEDADEADFVIILLYGTTTTTNYIRSRLSAMMNDGCDEHSRRRMRKKAGWLIKMKLEEEEASWQLPILQIYICGLSVCPLSISVHLLLPSYFISSLLLQLERVCVAAVLHLLRYLIGNTNMRISG